MFTRISAPVLFAVAFLASGSSLAQSTAPRLIPFDRARSALR